MILDYPLLEYQPVLRGRLFDDAEQLIRVNATLRAEGFKGKPWPANFLVIGAGKGDYYFLDADKPSSDSVFAAYADKPYHPHRLGKHLFQHTFREYLEYLRVMNNIMSNP